MRDGLPCSRSRRPSDATVTQCHAVGHAGLSRRRQSVLASRLPMTTQIGVRSRSREDSDLQSLQIRVPALLLLRVIALRDPAEREHAAEKREREIQREREREKEIQRDSKEG